MDPTAVEARLLLTSRRHALERSAAPSGFHGSAAVDDSAREEIREIDAALARIVDGSYGACERCGGAIGRQRLRALPEIRYCTGCTR